MNIPHSAIVFDHHKTRKIVDAAADEFVKALGGKHKEVIAESMTLLAQHFADDERTEGFTKDGAVAVAKFELGEDTDRDTRILRQREVSDLISTLLKKVGG